MYECTSQKVRDKAVSSMDFAPSNTRRIAMLLRTHSCRALFICVHAIRDPCCPLHFPTLSPKFEIWLRRPTCLCAACAAKLESTASRQRQCRSKVLQSQSHRPRRSCVTQESKKKKGGNRRNIVIKQLNDATKGK